MAEISRLKETIESYKAFIGYIEKASIAFFIEAEQEESDFKNLAKTVDALTANKPGLGADLIEAIEIIKKYEVVDFLNETAEKWSSSGDWSTNATGLLLSGVLTSSSTTLVSLINEIYAIDDLDSVSIRSRMLKLFDQILDRQRENRTRQAVDRMQNEAAQLKVDLSHFRGFYGYNKKLSKVGTRFLAAM